MDQTLHRVATKEREEVERTTKQKMARRHNREGGNHLDQESNRQTTMEDTDGGLHPAVVGQSLDERQDEFIFTTVLAMTARLACCLCYSNEGDGRPSVWKRFLKLSESVVLLTKYHGQSQFIPCVNTRTRYLKITDRSFFSVVRFSF